MESLPGYMEYSKTFNCETKMIILGVTERRSRKAAKYHKAAKLHPCEKWKAAKHTPVYDS